jgi:FkbM family methyltransferase
MDFSLRLYIIHRLKKFIYNKDFKFKSIVDEIIKRLFPDIKEKFIVKTLKGFKLIIDPETDKGIEYNIFQHGIYEKGTLDAFECIIKKGDIIIDLGANIGLTTIYESILAGKDGKVYSFEAHPKTYEILNKNISLNKCNNIYSVNKAISDNISAGFIYDNLDINRGAASLMKKNENQKAHRTDLTTLDNFVKENNINKIDFIKIDIEGYELKALKGFQEYLNINPKPIFCIELSFDVSPPEVINEIFTLFLEHYNYLAFRQKKGKSIGGNFIQVFRVSDLPKFDNIYFFQEEHLSFVKNIELPS